ncbi:hypothetical protein [Sporosarcina sp. FSL K6-2383]|uniref:hypothetical protein n=1 Tax=Sporosarcina sp. FSL K6-2383 TaxID=2921556 RepID=UPI00315AC2F6
MSMPLIKYESSDFIASERYVRIVQGLDDYFKANNTSGTDAVLNDEGLVPINLTTITPKVYSNTAEIIFDLEELKNEYKKLNSEIRSFYMMKQINSLISLVKWSSNEKFDFRRQVREFLYVNENPWTTTQAGLLHFTLQEKFKKIGLTEDVHSNYMKWKQDRLIPTEEIESTLNTLLEMAKVDVMEKMFPEVESVQVKVKIVHDVPYSAYCDYVNETMIINGDLEYTYESLKHLATHEVFPGHTTHMHIRESQYLKGNVPADAALVITNTASSPIFEGIGDNGMDFIDWNHTINDEIGEIVQTIKSVAGMNSSYQLNELQKDPTEVASFLRNFAFGQEEWIESRMRFIKHPLRGPFIYSYFRGYEGVRESFKQISNEQKQRYFEFLYHNMLTTDELKLFR